MKEKEIKPIIITDDATGMEYTLEFNRESVKYAESKGFQIEEVIKYPMSKIPELWFYSFRMHHSGISRAKTDELLDGIGDIPNGLLERLGELYATPFKSLMGNGGSKNSTVKVKF